MRCQSLGLSASGSELGLWALSFLAGLRVVAAQATYKFVTEPTPTNFQGFFPDGPKTERIQCATTETFSTYSTYAACCKTNQACGFISRCSAGIATEPNGKTGICPTSLANCYTMTIYASYPYASQSWLQMGCAREFSASKVFREIVPPATTSPSSSRTTLSTAPPATSASPTGGAISTGSPEPTPAAASQAWIAGAVIGPLVAAAAIGFFAFWYGRRRGRNNGTPTSIASASSSQGKPYTLSPDPDRGSYISVPAGAAYSVQYGGQTSPPPGGYAGGYSGGSPGHSYSGSTQYHPGATYDQGGQGYDGSQRYGSPPTGELSAGTPLGRYNPEQRSELGDGR